MPKIPSLTSLNVIKILEKNGFVLKRTTGSHYIYVHPVTRQRVTVPYHSGEDIAKGTLIEILKQAGITREELQNLL